MKGNIWNVQRKITMKQKKSHPFKIRKYYVSDFGYNYSVILLLLEIKVACYKL